MLSLNKWKLLQENNACYMNMYNFFGIEAWYDINFWWSMELWFRIGTDSCECGNEPLVSIKYENFVAGWGPFSFSGITLLHRVSYGWWNLWNYWGLVFSVNLNIIVEPLTFHIFVRSWRKNGILCHLYPMIQVGGKYCTVCVPVS